MMARIYSGALLGIDAYQVAVEIDLGLGLQVMNVVGLPDSAVRESKLRVPAALENAGFEYPTARITVNLAPADIRKDGTGFDLPIAAGILIARGRLPRERPEDDFRVDDHLIVGELGLDGEVRPIRGALSLALCARDHGLRGIVVPEANADEAAVVSGIEVRAVAHLRELCDWIEGRRELEPRVAEPTDRVERGASGYPVDFREVAGQEAVKRALEVAAAGGHNVLMLGPPGSGKSMLAKRIPTILPALDFEEALETTQIYSVVGQLDERDPLVRRRPFRAPHHTISDVGIVGGGSGIPRPGEISMAHNGVLFLDELPEFRKNVLEVMRQPLEDGSVTISRSLVTLSYPAHVMLVAAMNPCKCGYFGSPEGRCNCSMQSVQGYRDRISGPLMDRLDIQIEVPAVPYEELREAGRGESSATVRERVEEARARQRSRLAGTDLHCNAQMRPADLQQHCEIDAAGHRLLERVIDQLGMSARAYDRILKVARTIADLAGCDELRVDHLAEAVQYRTLDREVYGARAA